ncbi:MAG: porin [Burkholderiales bacterium]|nr:MAG: porin [Burkholderiales bacterium]
MKKTLLALAVAAALPAVAQAQSSNVTLYGIIDLSIANEDNGDDAEMFLKSGLRNGNRWGLKGSEDLGGGLSAFFNLESSISTDDGTGNDNFARRSFVGLKGGFGEVYFGRDYTPIFWVSLAGDPQGLGKYGNWVVGYNVRFSNAIHYKSPSFGGLNVRGVYVFDETRGSDAGQTFGLAVEYKGGPVYVGGAYHDINDVETEYALTGKVSFGAASVSLGYLRSDPDGPADGDETLQLGFGMDIGAGNLQANVQQRKSKDSDAKGTSFSVGYDHPISKRTMLYASFGMVNNNSTGAFGWGISPAGAGEDPRGIALGLRHTF